MKRRTIAWLAVLALAVSIAAGSVLADEQEDVMVIAPNPVAASPAGPDGLDVVIVPDELGTVSYANVERRMRENNLTLLAVQERVTMLEELDYEELAQDLLDEINSWTNKKWLLNQGIPAYGIPGTADRSSFASVQLQQIIDGMNGQYEAIRDGEMQEDNQALLRQMKNGQDQLVMYGEMLYVTVAGLEVTEAQLQRQLASLNRTVEEMELRYGMGQVSALQLTQTKAGRTQLVSGLETLRMNLRNAKTQLEYMLGAEQTGKIRLMAMPEVTQAQLDGMDVERDLLTAKENSYTLYDAAKTLEDEREAYQDVLDKYTYNEEATERKQAEHTWQAAQYTYNDAVQTYELTFRQLYAQVQDYAQVLNAAKVSLESEKAEFVAAELKYQQGTISQNAYLTAQDDLHAAEDAVQTASNDLFASYNTYCWAVQHGILN